MRLELELQYAEFHPDQVKKIGQVNVDQALEIIHAFPWDREFAKIEERTKENLTSTVPSISIKNRDNEMLIVSARDKNNFIIEILTPTHHGEEIIPSYSLNNKQGLTTEDVVTKFYDGTVREIFKLKPLKPSSTNDQRVYTLAAYPLFVTTLMSGILILILIFDLGTNGLTSKALPGIYFVGFMILISGPQAMLTVQYILNDWGKEISFNNEGLIIKQKGQQVNIKKSEVTEIVIIENPGSRYLNHYKYARIKTKAGQAFIVTSFVIEPIELVNKLKVNHKEESVFFLPTISLDIPSEKERQRIKRDKEKKKGEFLQTYKNYEDSKLKKIIADKTSYADYAVEAATEILEQRRKL
ncbi:MAG: hypothetical protein HYZ44_16900 [Bacteroidetes bacterium]|nr:hypothetical protein [Bacteroidota bacterium]